MAGKQHVLSNGAGPIAAGGLDDLKARAEKLVRAIVGDTAMKWEPAEKVEGDDVVRLVLHRKSGFGLPWITVGYAISEVPVLGTKKAKG